MRFSQAQRDCARRVSGKLPRPINRLTALAALHRRLAMVGGMGMEPRIVDNTARMPVEIVWPPWCSPCL
jgi:hypothetical protein